MEIAPVSTQAGTPRAHAAPASDARAAQAAAGEARGIAGTDAALAREASKLAPEQSDQARADALRAQEARLDRDTHGNIAGTIQFEQEEGTRVMKVLDSKDVLIYQVPSKGELTLIKAEEAASRRMLVRA